MDTARGTLVKDAPPDPVVAVDFDRTIMDDEGRLISGAKESLAHLKSTGWKIIIWTGNPDLDRVKEFLQQNEIPYDHINENPDTDKKMPTRKVFFNATVDDKAVPFEGDWRRALTELEHRRDLWRLDGTTKSIIKIKTADREGRVETLAAFALQEGRAIQVSGNSTAVIRELAEHGLEGEDGVVRPEHGLDFMKALLGLQGTYLWAELSD